MHVTADFWAEQCYWLQTELSVTMLCLPQTDWVPAILNQQLTQYQQAFTVHYQDMLITLFPLLEYGYNSPTDFPTDQNQVEWNLPITPSIPVHIVVHQWQHDAL